MRSPTVTKRPLSAPSTTLIVKRITSQPRSVVFKQLRLEVRDHGDVGAVLQRGVGCECIKDIHAVVLLRAALIASDTIRFAVSRSTR